MRCAQFRVDAQASTKAKDVKMASIFRRRGEGPYIISYFDQTGRRRERSSRTTDKKTADRIASKLEADVALRREGIIDAQADRVAAAARRPLELHMNEFRDDLNARGVTPKHAAMTLSHVKKLIQKLEATNVCNLTPSAVQVAIGAVRTSGASLRTCNSYLRSIKHFNRWLSRNGRIQQDQLAHLSAYNADSDRRHERRALTDDELNRLIAIAESSPVKLGMSGKERAISYRIGLGTGFRLAELKCLTPECFDLDADPPTMTVPAAYSKRRRTDVQPIREDLAEQLKSWLAEKTRGEPVLELPDKASKMIKADLRRARALWIKEVPGRSERRKRNHSSFLKTVDDEGRVCDFHSLRHTYVTRLVSSGASVKVCQELARHSTPNLTIGRYAHTRLHDLRNALDNLPGIGTITQDREAVALRPTGTRGAPKHPSRFPSTQSAFCSETVRRLATTPPVV